MAPNHATAVTGTVSLPETSDKALQAQRIRDAQHKAMRKVLRRDLVRELLQNEYAGR